MTVSSTTNTTGTTNTSTNSSALSLNADFTMFLKLLTTQMQNQDPLDPMDTSQYTQQLVQYSQVEQSIQQNSTLKDILSGLTNQGLSQASGLIGHEVEFDTDTAGLNDGPATWSWAANADITQMKVSIADTSGKVVETRTVDVDGATGRFEWDGSLSSGGTANHGNYVLTLTGTNAAGVSVPVTASAIGTVDEVRSINGTVTLGVNGAQFPMTLVSKVSAAS